jgi:hypothetical protein
MTLTTCKETPISAFSLGVDRVSEKPKFQVEIPDVGNIFFFKDGIHKLMLFKTIEEDREASVVKKDSHGGCSAS